MANNSLYEYSVNPEIKGFYKFLYVFLKVISIIDVVLAIITSIYAFYFSNLAWLVCLLFIISVVVIYFIQKSLFSSYDLAFVDGSIRLDRVFNNRRKRLLKFDCKNILSIGGVNGDVYNKYINDKSVKKINLLGNTFYSKDFCVFIEVNGVSYLILIRYDEIFLSNIIRISGGKIIEKSYKDILVK